MFWGKSAITALLAVATTILLSAGQAQAQGRGNCGGRQSGTTRGTGQQQGGVELTSSQVANRMSLAIMIRPMGIAGRRTR